jgi:outer membrane protein OmpA-like peptidoglycan-associated protein
MRCTNRLGILLAAFSALLLLNACAGRVVMPEPTLESNDPVEQLLSLESDLQAAEEQQLEVLAPTSFARAEQLYQDARQMLVREEQLSAILLQITSGRVELQRAEQSAQIARTVLPDVIKVRGLALTAGAADLGKEFEVAEEGFLKLTRAIEDNDLEWARRHKSKIFDAFDRLELRAIKEKYLSEARELVLQGEQNRAAKTAPQTLAEARARLQQADDFITANRYLQEDIRNKTAEALFYARRLHIILQQSDDFKDLSPEQTALKMEHLLHATAGQLAAPDQRDQLFEDQLESILATIEAWENACHELNDEVVAQQGVIDKLRTEIAAMEGLTQEEREARERLVEEKQVAKKRLVEERRFQELFTQVQSLFDPREAEVYKQANRLVVRLKTMQFPVGSAVILSENYPLLSKVQRAIRLFGEPQTIVEGHTDSTGSITKNLALSQSRAEAVRSYLVANETLPAEKVEAAGFGSERPLASEATAEGRAINRRIDIVIIPTPPKETP